MMIRPSAAFLLSLALWVSACTLPAWVVVEHYTLQLVVDDPHASVTEFERMAAALGGSVEDGSPSFMAFQVEEGTVYQATLEMRIPLNRVQAALTRLENAAIEVGYSSASREDRTTEYGLLAARREELLGAREHFLRLMDTKPNQPDDFAAADDLLRELGNDLKQIESRIKQLEQESATPYVSVELIPMEVRQLTVPSP